MGEAPATVKCDRCRLTARRYYGSINSQEDRYRFFRNNQDGGTFSFAMGMEHPQDRASYHAACAALGSEPVTPKTTPTRWKEDREYLQHVQTGGERLERDGHVAEKGTVTVLDQLKKSPRLGL